MASEQWDHFAKSAAPTTPEPDKQKVEVAQQPAVAGDGTFAAKKAAAGAKARAGDYLQQAGAAVKECREDVQTNFTTGNA